MDIQEQIMKKLGEIEQKEHVRILHAVESGSRAWGFPSPDSDYDVRFVYVRQTEDYLRLSPPRDVIEWELNEIYDLSGWDLQKALRLMYKSNPTFFEWCASPIVYRTTDIWQDVKNIADSYFSVKAGSYHYLSMAKTTYRTYLKGDTVRVKKYFYVLRPLLACRWVLTHGTPPPMLFSELTESMLAPEIRPITDELVSRKMQTPELGEEPMIPELNAYIEESISLLERMAEEATVQRNTDTAPLDRLFLRILGNESTMTAGTSR